MRTGGTEDGCRARRVRESLQTLRTFTPFDHVSSRNLHSAEMQFHFLGPLDSHSPSGLCRHKRSSTAHCIQAGAIPVLRVQFCAGVSPQTRRTLPAGRFREHAVRSHSEIRPAGSISTTIILDCWMHLSWTCDCASNRRIRATTEVPQSVRADAVSESGPGRGRA